MIRTPRKFSALVLLSAALVLPAAPAWTEPNCTKRQYGSNWIAVCDEGANTAPLYKPPDIEAPPASRSAPHPDEDVATPSPVTGSSGDGRVNVHGYTKRDGTYVAPHTRSAPRGRR